MIASESLDIIERTVKSLRQAGADQPPPVIIAPQWWVQKIKAALGAEPDAEIETVSGCPVTVAEVAEPSLVAADGRTWSIIPAWLRARHATEIQAIDGDRDGQDH